MGLHFLINQTLYNNDYNYDINKIAQFSSKSRKYSTVDDPTTTLPPYTIQYSPPTLCVKGIQG